MPRRNDRANAVEKAPLGSDWARAVELLRYADFAEVGRALGVSSSAVQKWYWGTNIGPDQVLRLEKLLGHKEEAAPNISERLDEILDWVVAIADATSVPDDAIAAIEAAHHAVRDQAPGLPRPGAAHPRGKHRPPGK